MKHAIFVDTWAFRALADSADPAHGEARLLDEALTADGVERVTSDYVLDEALTGLRARAGFRVARRFLDEVEGLAAAAQLRIERVSEARFAAAGALFRRLDGKHPRLSFTDCTSFAIMREEEILWAFTADAHFDHVGRDVRAALVLRPDGTAQRRAISFETRPRS